ncbi:DUF4125 family protein [Chloroflexota bacterium]
MTEEEMILEKPDLISRILAIELGWFLTVNPQITSECQQHPEAFNLMRGSSFETWSEKTLELYIEHLLDAQDKDRNLVREKYAKLQGLMPCENESPALVKSVEIEKDWHRETASKYPNIIKEEAGPMFLKYLRCELDTYSQRVLESYYKDRLKAKEEGRNLTTETYNNIARKLGYSSVEEMSQKQGK